jgi:protein-L-isoaspartate(D-aspartate) O-methyltransferase
MNGGDDPSARLRAEMVQFLREQGQLSDARIAAAFGAVPRHVFIPGVELTEAYADRAVPTRFQDGVPTSAASQPAVVATMLEHLRPAEGASILEIGAGTGYNAALLATLVGSAGRVVTVDIDPDVAEEAEAHLSQAGISNVEVICGDGAQGWPDNAPYDGIIVTAGASDIAPAWVGQLAPAGRLVVPLSLRGVQQCVTFVPAGGHLSSVAVCECGFMPLVGAMANTDGRLAVPGHPGVHMVTAAGTVADAGVIRDGLRDQGPCFDIGIRASSLEVFGSLRRWLGLLEPTSALLTYIGTEEDAEASGVPPVIDFVVRGGIQRSSPCLLGPRGFAVLDLAAPPVPASEAGLQTVLDLAVVTCGSADREAMTLIELVAAWDAAGRPGADLLRIDAYPDGASPPETEGVVVPARHATFVVTAW